MTGSSNPPQSDQSGWLDEILGDTKAYGLIAPFGYGKARAAILSHEAGVVREAREQAEVWKPYNSFPFTTEYEISSAGRVRRDGKILVQSDNGTGYLVVSLSKDNIRKNYLVHRLVAQAFLINASGKLTVNHLDGDKKNNCVNNLEWATHQENERHSFDKLGKTVWNKGTATIEITQCMNCGKDITDKKWRKRKYCDHHCQAIHNNNAKRIAELSAATQGDSDSLSETAQPEEIIWWPYEGKYDKIWYDIKLKNGDIFYHCWPNAGAFHTETGAIIYEGSDVTHIAISKEQS